MKGKEMLKVLPCILLLTLFLPAMASADPGNQYCITPPFITAGIKPNMLLLMDNSASMYDLAYVDKGKKHCNVTTDKSCSIDLDCSYCSVSTDMTCSNDLECPGGEECNTTEICSEVDRQPFFCYDETYRNVNSYYGYFDKDKYYYYREATDDFAEQPSGYTYTCTTGAYTTKNIANVMCLQFTVSPKDLIGFVAKGNYLNWLTASKLDIQKSILTGGKYDGSAMIPESRGCVGRAYVKDVNTADFVNYDDGSSNTNVPLGVTFTISGEPNPNNPTAPSTGGQTYINIYSAVNKQFNFALCQTAMKEIYTGTNADIKQSVGACLASTGVESGSCRLPALLPHPKGAMSCTTNSECILNSGVAQTGFVCNRDTAKSCSGTADTSCLIPARNSCSGMPTIACTAATEAIACKPVTPEKLGRCSLDKAMYAPAPGKNDTPPLNKSCRQATEAADCTFRSTGTDFVGKAGVCEGYSGPVTNDYTPCIETVETDYGPCISNYVGDCLTTAQAAAVKTKVSFQQSMQECWAIRGTVQTAPMYGFSVDAINTVKNMCPDIYANYKTCSNNHLQQCTANGECGVGTCVSGPGAIGNGNPALLCGTSYAGAFYAADSNGNWQLSGTNSQLAEAHYRFCNLMQASPVTDPTDAPGNTAIADNLPSILSGLGVESQLGTPIATMKAKLTTATAPPPGLVQQFGANIRLGAMSFNPYGSQSETANTGIPKTCSDGRICTLDADCGGTLGSCAATTAGTTNLDGARIIYPIGWGLCATMTTTPCKLDANCSSPNTCLEGYCGEKGATVCTTVANCSGTDQACIANGVGSHTTAQSLVKALDDIRATSWTPFAEAFYNAMGYYARIPSGADAGKSRTALRLSSLRSTSTDYTDFTTAPGGFNEDYNPSEYRCQQNYVLLVSDGASTADNNTNVGTLADLYDTPAGIVRESCAGAAPPPTGFTGITPHYLGNNYLPIMTWLGKNRNIAEFNLSGTASTAVPTTARESVTTYVVFNGESNGASGDCNSYTLLQKAADKGGTSVKQANDYPGLVKALTGVFQDVAARAASGTAASILSNSEGSGANILQAVFYPKKIFEEQKQIKWIGEMQNLWYYVDPYINNSTIREDTDKNNKLHLINDYVARFAFDNTADKTMVQLYRDTDGDGTGDTISGGLIDPDYVKSLWRAGKILWSRNIVSSPRKLFTSINATNPAAPPSLMYFSSDTFPGMLDAAAVASNSDTLAPYLNVTTAAAPALINWVHGQDQSGLRERTVKIKDPVTNAVVEGVWRLGDIISSTPRVQSTVRLNTYNLPQPGGYNDNSYLTFINSNQYKNRGMIYVGGNDGMFHAFKLGNLSVTSQGMQKATLDGTDLGKEMWAYIPKNALPYLKYMSDPDYSHLYYVDGRTSIFDASIGYTGIDSCVRATYDTCDKIRNDSVVDNGNNLVAAKNTWRSVVIGGMGLGGASTLSCTAGDDCVQTPIADPDDGTKGLGYSSYFAFDVTDPNNPSLLWEFSDPALGYSLSGPSIVRIGDKEKNGKWFAVFGSGPTGPINTSSRQFMARSNQTLKFFVVDLQTGVLARTIDTGIVDAFAGSMLGGAIDSDRSAPTVAGNYQDDAIYVGYTRRCTATDTGCVSGTWTTGGVLRIMTKESAPADATTPWVWSTIMDNIGPVTTAISRLQDKKNRNLWLYFGTGRYYFRDSTGLDDPDDGRRLFGIKEPCYNTATVPGNFLDKNCTAVAVKGTLQNQSDTINTIAAGNSGWYINLDPKTASEAPERVVTDTVALTNGTVFFTTFKPTMDICGYGGNSYLWGVNFATGDSAPLSALQGKALIQLSTGEFKEVDLPDAFGHGDPDNPLNRGKRRMATPMTGKPPSDAPPIVSNSMNRPIKKILHIQEH